MSPRRRLLLIIAAAAALVLVAVLGIRLLTGRADQQARPDQARPGTVLLVPGYGGSQVALTRLAARLTTAGRVAKVVALPGDGTGDLLVQAGALDDAVRAELTAGAPSVDLIGYSAGGVVAKLWVDRHDGATAARRVVTLGRRCTAPSSRGSAPPSRPGPARRPAASWRRAVSCWMTSTVSRCRTGCPGCRCGPRTTRRCSHRTRRDWTAR